MLNKEYNNFFSAIYKNILMHTVYTLACVHCVLTKMSEFNGYGAVDLNENWNTTSQVKSSAVARQWKIES